MQCTRTSILAVVVVTVAVQPVAAQDTVRVSADNPPVWGANVRLVQELAIGQADGPQEYAFGRIYHAAPDRDGGFYLYDVNDSQIRHYDTRGRFTGLIGRKGGGPGEYQHVGGMMVDRSGSLVVFDPGARRITHFGPDGKVRREQTTTRGSFDAFVLDSADRMYFIVTAGGRMMEGPGVQQQFLRLSPDGKVIDSLPIPIITNRTPIPQTFALSTSDGMRHNFIEEPLFAPYLSGGMIAARSGAYRVIVNDGSRRVTVVERNAQPVRLGAEERAQWLEFADTMRLRGSGPYDIPRSKPLLRGVRSDHLGRIWAEVYVEAEKRTNLPPTRTNGGKQILFWRERTTYDVFSPQGQYLGRIALPQESVLLAISGNRLYTRGRGPDDEERLVVFRIAISDRP
jgi:6-bladed beta-propeller protein